MPTCPRRMLEFGPWAREEGLDSWEGSDGAKSNCSFCGSLNPDFFMDQLCSGAVLGPTDKSYKVYVHSPASFEEAAERKRAWIDGGMGQAVRAVLAANGVPDEEIDDRVEEDWLKQEAPMIQGPYIGKFYYQHLSADQREQFIGMLNAGQVTIGYPGHLYVLPYFCVRKEAS